MDIFKKARSELRPLEPSELDGAELCDVEIKREREHTDLLILCQQLRFALVIENKVDSQDHPGQLARYERKVRDRWGSWEVLYPTSKYIDFLPKTWLTWLPPFAPDDDYPLCVQLRTRETKKKTNLSYIIWLGPMKNVEKRKEIATKLREECSGIGFVPSTGGVAGRWLRITEVDRILEWPKDKKTPLDVGERVKEMLNKLDPKLEKLGLLLKALLKSK